MLPDALIARWRARNGMSTPGRHGPMAPEIRYTGADGLRNYGQHVEVSVPNPGEFDAVMHVGTLGRIGTFCSLHTPMRLERSTQSIREWPADVVVFGVHRMGNGILVTQGKRDHAYQPGQLTFVSNAAPYVQHATSISDPAGLVIPIELLGREGAVAIAADRPVAIDTLLSRAAAAYTRQLAFDVARGDTDTSAGDTEAATIELMRAALGHLNYAGYRLDDNPVFVRQAARDVIERRHRDRDFAVPAIAQALHLSRRQLYRHFESEDRSLAQLIAAQRLATATRLLTEQPALQLDEVATASGFASATTMRNHFRSEYGMTPSEFRLRG